VVAGDTRYLDAALAQVHAAGDTVKPEDVKRLSPPLLDHVNVLGRYDFALTESIRRGSYDRFAAPTSRMIWLHRKPYAGFLFLCGQVGYVASSRSMPGIQLVFELERHITISSQLEPPGAAAARFSGDHDPGRGGLLLDPSHFLD
jgi:Tn3 transposase DDE domain